MNGLDPGGVLLTAVCRKRGISSDRQMHRYSAPRESHHWERHKHQSEQSDKSLADRPMWR